MRSVMIVLAALVAVAGIASAQVAAPRLNPVAIESNSAFNPATLSWNRNMVGGAYSDVTVEETPSGQPTEEAATGNGYMLQGRYVSEFFAAGLEIQDVSLDLNATTIGAGTFEISSQQLGVAGQYGGIVSVGIAQQNSEVKFDLSDGTFSETEENSMPYLGVTVRMLEQFYVGVAAGNETFTYTTSGTSVANPGTVENDRSVLRYGLGTHMRDGEMGWHVEIYREEIDEISNAVQNFGWDAFETTGFTVEGMYANVFLGVESISTDGNQTRNPLLAKKQSEDKTTTISIGWAPMEGLNAVATLGKNEETRVLSGDKTTFDSITLGVGWAF